MHKPRLLIKSLSILLALMCFSTITTAAEKTYVREYTYQASEADSKLSARTIALQEVKRELLSELGTHVSSLVTMQSDSDGRKLNKEEIETLSAGVTRVEILDEKWNGVTYILKAQITADPEDVLKSLHKMLDADKKQKQITQLGDELSNIRAQNINISESLTQSKQEATAALAEIARLKKLLNEKQTPATQQTLQGEYQQQVDILTVNEWFDSAVEHYQKGEYPAAFPLFKKVAEQGYASAQHNLGLMYYNGEGVARDTKQAAYWWQKAAEQSIADAQYNLGLMYANGEGVARDPKQAVYWWRKAAEQGYGSSQYNLGLMYDKGDGVVRDPKQAVYWWHKAAEQGDAKAQLNLGNRYSNGEGVARDLKQALYWYQKAAKQGLSNAQNNLGNMYAKGEGVSRDPKQAVYWYQKAAEQGEAGAQYNLGMKHAKGEGVARDPKQAVYWIQKAAELGLVDAQYNLGVIYDNGIGVPRDLKQAGYWWQKAAEQGDASAQFNLGAMYYKGGGVVRDPKQAVYWWQKAAEQGQVNAQKALKMAR